MTTRKARDGKSEGVSSKPSEDLVKYPIERLRSHAATLFGVALEVFDGALYGVQDVELSKSEVEQKIKVFLEREVN